MRSRTRHADDYWRDQLWGGGEGSDLGSTRFGQWNGHCDLLEWTRKFNAAMRSSLDLAGPPENSEV
jgi:hypothetical protein